MNKGKIFRKNSDVLVFIPCYNEKDNVRKIHKEIRELNIRPDILFVDDNSPDGTGEILDQMSQKDRNLFVMHRSGKLGIGSAHQAGIEWAYTRGYGRLITMDCDFTHPPEYIPKLIESLNGYDIVSTSRYMRKGSLKGWNIIRKTLTHLGHLMTKFLLKMPYDATGAFRLYDLERIPKDIFSLVASKGYSFFFESLYVLNLNGFKIKEIPIHLPPRTYGSSKMETKDIIQSLKQLYSTYTNTVSNRDKYLFKNETEAEPIGYEQEWDIYWKKQKNAGNFLYDSIASFYRTFIIKPTLNHFIKKYFSPGSSLLHAGCGSGQVDTDISKKFKVTAMDVSINALKINKKVHKNRCKLLKGDIFAIPLSEESVDGIYNLGVMEHFTQEDIQRILKEFHKVLKENGKIVIFWPPEFGSSVTFLKMVKFGLEKIFRKKDVKIHPDEISRIQSREQAIKIFEKADFNVLEYYFGPRDFFTHSIIIAQKRSN
jgi:dolichol-phosphate mannosyltransferase